MTKRILLAVTALALAACAGVPDPPGCDGAYRSLNPTHYTLKDTVHEAPRTTLGAG